MDGKSDKRKYETNVSEIFQIRYYNTAKNYIILLQKHERAPDAVKELRDGDEGEEFLSLWKEELSKNKQAIFSDIVQDWNVWYKEVDNCFEARLTLQKNKQKR